MGLAALLVRCGVALPCEGGEGAQVAPRCDFFAEVVTDISATADVQAGTSCVAHPHPHCTCTCTCTPNPTLTSTLTLT